MKKYEKKKSVKVLETISISLFLIALLGIILAIFNLKFLLSIFIFPCILPIIWISKQLDTIEDYTKEFITYINKKLDSAKNLEDLVEIQKEFESLAIENKMYCLSDSITIRKLHEKILNQIEILEKYETN